MRSGSCLGVSGSGVFLKPTDCAPVTFLVRPHHWISCSCRPRSRNLLLHGEYCEVLLWASFYAHHLRLFQLPVAVSSLIVMLPGKPFTLALTEVVAGSIQAGTTRFFSACINTLQACRVAQRFFFLRREYHRNMHPLNMQIGLGLAMGAQFVHWGNPWSLQTDQCGAQDWALPLWGVSLALLIGKISYLSGSPR